MSDELSEQHDLFQELTRKFVERRAPLSRTRALLEDPSGYDADVWAEGATAGWLELAVPAQPGNPPDVVALGIAAQELGRALFPGPLISTSAVAYTIARAGSTAVRDAHLEGLTSGGSIGSLQWFPDDSNPGASDLHSTRSSGGYVLSGTLGPLADAGIADVVLATTHDLGGTTVFVVPTGVAKVSVSPLSGLDLTRRFAEVTIRDLEVSESAVLGPVGNASGLVTEQDALVSALLCSETVGATERAFELTLDYVRTRKAFGRAIGAFQALKHRLADMLLWLEGAKAATAAALESLATGKDSEELVSVACAYVTDRSRVIARECLQLHGGIGFTWEYDIHLYMRRIESNAVLLGGPIRHYDRIADLLHV